MWVISLVGWDCVTLSYNGPPWGTAPWNMKAIGSPAAVVPHPGSVPDSAMKYMSVLSVRRQGGIFNKGSSPPPSLSHPVYLPLSLSHLFIYLCLFLICFSFIDVNYDQRKVKSLLHFPGTFPLCSVSSPSSSFHWRNPPVGLPGRTAHCGVLHTHPPTHCGVSVPSPCSAVMSECLLKRHFDVKAPECWAEENVHKLVLWKDFKPIFKPNLHNIFTYSDPMALCPVLKIRVPHSTLQLRRPPMQHTAASLIGRAHLWVPLHFTLHFNSRVSHEGVLYAFSFNLTYYSQV